MKKTAYFLLVLLLICMVTGCGESKKYTLNSDDMGGKTSLSSDAGSGKPLTTKDDDIMEVYDEIAYRFVPNSVAEVEIGMILSLAEMKTIMGNSEQDATVYANKFVLNDEEFFQIIGKNNNPKTYDLNIYDCMSEPRRNFFAEFYFGWFNIIQKWDGRIVDGQDVATELVMFSNWRSEFESINPIHILKTNVAPIMFAYSYTTDEMYIDDVAKCGIISGEVYLDDVLVSRYNIVGGSDYLFVTDNAGYGRYVYFYDCEGSETCTLETYRGTNLVSAELEYCSLLVAERSYDYDINYDKYTTYGDGYISLGDVDNIRTMLDEAGCNSSYDMYLIGNCVWLLLGD